LGITTLRRSFSPNSAPRDLGMVIQATCEEGES
jgi:hypothetical protein